jgi:hypothetical protein
MPLTHHVVEINATLDFVMLRTSTFKCICMSASGHSAILDYICLGDSPFIYFESNVDMKEVQLPKLS